VLIIDCGLLIADGGVERGYLPNDPTSAINNLDFRISLHAASAEEA